ncbi:helix-turn-helix domain-containing protein [Actinomadura madurae]|uniref:helix-turn-helix domain-containing protein n=1 Tax=Actinomadura madurae TaxID=1993 RepID=UPI000D9AD61A|nr:helix-turn-helix domain-containing protein [Actinomadura madurae]MCP9954064.1 helix-turn-helix domain-containing protein [Actinomadura madurae]MCP9970808.1 helix-turn-helix domain-containing protein [Actinomadura madurae]MCP9983287.1 helix-turn-helix domain-containing protein [Actinomadura madurae]MCQ0019535.1 helix-turn-helix domain-containing protein [Actinomadura madurae]URM99547.1 helix-turn-helix domain-containing protein [Actinomadura madurae]
MDDVLGGAVRQGAAYRLVLYLADRADYVRTAGQARRDRGYRFLLPLHGELLMEQDGREARLRPGTGGLIAPAAPFRVVQPRPARALVMTIPAQEMDGRLPGPSLPLTGLDLSTGLGRVVADMVRAVGAERGALTAPQFDAACERITELLCLLVTGQEHPPAPGHLAEVEAVVRRYVREHATDPGLTGAAMAQDLGWSLRQIQLALQRAGTTPRALIREERLRLVRDRLRNPRDRHVTITDIAHATGFSSASALSHAFRRRFGVSPRELRSR